MAEKKPFIAARLRNPAEDAAATPKVAKKAGFDIVGNIASLIALGIAGYLLFVLYQEFEAYNLYLGLI